MDKHGIFKNDNEKKYEAWFHNRLIGTCSYLCGDNIVKLWKSRYSKYLKR